MIKRIIIAIMILSIVSVLGCEEISRLTQEPTQKSSSANLKILKAVELGAEWEMKQITFDVGAGKEVSILLKLAEGDEVDGYFFLEKGDRVDFSITGKTFFDKFEIPDRFSFVANQSQGDTYTLTFHNSAEGEKKQATVTVFLEVIYPITGSLYIPVEGE